MIMSIIRRTGLRLGMVVFMFAVALQTQANHSVPTPSESHPARGSSPNSIFDNPLHARSLMELLQVFLQGIVYIGSIALLLALVWCGFLFVMAQGKEESLNDAKRTLMWTLIGGLILLGAEGIAVMIEATGSQL